MSEQLIYIDGEFYTKSEAKVSVFDHGFLYGDGVFEGIRAYHGKVFKLQPHIERLYDSAKAIGLVIPVSKEEMSSIVVESCRRNGIANGYIRLVVSRGVGDLGLNPYLCKKASIVCIAATIQLYPQELYQQGLDIVTVATPRNHPEALNPRIKSLNYMNNIMAKMEAIRAGVQEAVMLNLQGYVAECTGDNLFILRNGKLVTPPATEGALEGITRNAVIDLARQKGIEVREERMSRFDIYTSQEMFLTGTGAELIPVVKVDGRAIGEGSVGPVFKGLLADFQQLTRVDGAPIPGLSA
ncbi:MAG: branched-chain-amino-acid transaminase [Fibrobacterota bacterium]|nr:branched-chain-amino-acid transaminase [Fibrobacterota bacterium]QQS03094.1 MAG: branched-chain-amino-acid transaminase [Fibrobacterota bacterium]